MEARDPGMSAQALVDAVQPTLDTVDLPAGHRMELGGELADQAEADANLFGLLPIAFGGIVLLLVGQFNSIRRAGSSWRPSLVMIGGTV